MPSGGKREGAGRKPYKMTEEHREKIKNSRILQCLVEHVQGTRKMDSSQVTAGLGLLRKVLPDLSAVDLSGEVTTSYVAEVPQVSQDGDEWERQHAPKTLQ